MYRISGYIASWCRMGCYRKGAAVMYDVIIIGAGASGLMASIFAAKRGRKVLILDHADKAGKKILVSGGGKCNFTNRYISVNDYFGYNNSFCKYPLKHFTTESVLKILKEADIEIEERDFGRLFCKKSAVEIVSYLVGEAKKAGVHFFLNANISEVSFATCFCIRCEDKQYESSHLLVATGGLAWPQIGATNFGYVVAKQFGHKIAPLKPALAGFILLQDSPLMNLQGISLNAQLQIVDKSPAVEEPLLFTHKGISGPAALQLSCYWEKDDVITINFLPSENVISEMHKPGNGKKSVGRLLMQFLPERLVKAIVPNEFAERKVAELGKKCRNIIAGYIHSFPVHPCAIEGFSKAEATLGGVLTDEINPKNMESLLMKGLYFSGEVIDITGKLGGYNIHWAFASGFIAGQKI